MSRVGHGTHASNLHSTVTREHKQQLHCTKTPQKHFHFSNINYTLTTQINTHPHNKSTPN